MRYAYAAYDYIAVYHKGPGIKTRIRKKIPMYLSGWINIYEILICWAEGHLQILSLENESSRGAQGLS